MTKTAFQASKPRNIGTPKQGNQTKGAGRVMAGPQFISDANVRMLCLAIRSHFHHIDVPVPFLWTASEICFEQHIWNNCECVIFSGTTFGWLLESCRETNPLFLVPCKHISRDKSMELDPKNGFGCSCEILRKPTWTLEMHQPTREHTHTHTHTHTRSQQDLEQKRAGVFFSRFEWNLKLNYVCLNLSWSVKKFDWAEQAV